METDEEALRNLLRDNFIAHHTDSSRVKPVILPLSAAVASVRPVKHLNRLKDDIMDTSVSNSTIDMDIKPEVRSISMMERKPETVTRRLSVSSRRPTLPPVFEELFGSAEEKSNQGNLFFIQLPNVLSDLLITGSGHNEATQTTPSSAATFLVKDEPMDVEENISTYPNGVSIKTEPGAEIEITTPVEKPETDQKSKKRSHHTLSDIPQGRIGKLQLMKSGRVRLKLNDAGSEKPLIFDATPGTKTSFLQHVVGIKIPDQQDDEAEQERGKLYVLGDVSHRLLFTPKIDDLLTGLKKASR